ncbi:MAG: hypothetical protein JOY92_14800 [Verrucomicrobia bacterium]|nr:hypothetical protein [Verrucomicrobiota bacterium]
MDYPPRVYHFSLHTIGLVVGLWLLAVHGIGLLWPARTQAWLERFPRSLLWGRVLIVVAALWSFWLAWNMDLGEFSGARPLLKAVIPVLAVLTALYVQEFLAVRALGILFLLAGEPILSAAFLKPPETRLFLVVPAYAWIIIGMFWVGKPYLLRDQISWLSKSPVRWRAATVAGVLYGVIVLACTLTQF